MSSPVTLLQPDPSSGPQFRTMVILQLVHRHAHLGLLGVTTVASLRVPVARNTRLVEPKPKIRKFISDLRNLSCPGVIDDEHLGQTGGPP